MRVVIFTPTRLAGGMDIIWGSLQRLVKGYDPKLVTWLCADELLEHRNGVHEFIGRSVGIPAQGFRVQAPIGKKRTLAASYNHAIRIASEMGAEVFISLQDYIAAPTGGLVRFVENVLDFPDCLHTGLCHHSNGPVMSDVFSRESTFSIFQEPYTSYPEISESSIGWWDVRSKPTEERLLGIPPMEWELNWAAIPLFRLGSLRFDEEYDRGYGHENQDFAMRWCQAGGGLIMDQDNVAISLPHRLYFPEVVRQDNMIHNREFHDRKWGLTAA